MLITIQRKKKIKERRHTGGTDGAGNYLLVDQECVEASSHCVNTIRTFNSQWAWQVPTRHPRRQNVFLSGNIYFPLDLVSLYVYLFIYISQSLSLSMFPNHNIFFYINTCLSISPSSYLSTHDLPRPLPCPSLLTDAGRLTDQITCPRIDFTCQYFHMRRKQALTASDGFWKTFREDFTQTFFMIFFPTPTLFSLYFN